ncbi:MAG: hypothetical protein ACRECX_02545 [Methyloceanibacter sp.]|uniref:hypothetical protein n=1 Tax=Methyloceanibacter sp. TaxID=1965321 RepID=UPI003D6C73D1
MGVVLSLLLFCMTGVVGTALAEDAAGAKIEALLPPNPGAEVCYARVYDADHLKRHPKQRVTEMIFSLRYLTFEENEDGTPEEANYQYWFTLAAKLRGNPEMHYANGACGSSSGVIGCGVECDGGGIELEPRADGDLLARLERDGGEGFIRLTPGCGDEEGVTLEAGEDDKVFKLPKVPEATCNAMQAEFAKRLE